MTDPENLANGAASVEEIQQGWHDLASRVEQLESERSSLEQENKALRSLLERVIEHRQKSHAELVLLLTGLVSKLPINDVGALVAKLVEHNEHVSEVCAALAKGKADASLPQPAILKALDQVKRELQAALKKAVDELIALDTPLETDMLKSLAENPELFFSPPVIRANRCFLKGQVPRERVVKEFGEAALVFFNDLTTNRKRNPNPKPEEILLGFKDDFEVLFQQHPDALPDKRAALMEFYRKIQQTKAPTEKANTQRNALFKLSFILELLHYYENQNTEAPDVVFAQRLPALIEQLVITGPQDNLDEKLIAEAEKLLSFVVSPDHRHMIVNNVGKVSPAGRILRYVLTLREEKVSELDYVVSEFVKHLLPKKTPPAGAVAAVLRLTKPEMQRPVVMAIMETNRLPKAEAEELGKAVGKELGLTGLDAPRKARESVPPEVERQLAWDKIKDLIVRRNDPAIIASAIRDRLHAKYDADEIKQSWVTLTEADPISLIRVFCHLPYLADGRTDPVARAVMETYVSRLLHEKYAAAYHKVLTSLKNMFRANPSSPTLLNFVALVKWVDPGAASKLCTDVGIQVPA